MTRNLFLHFLANPFLIKKIRVIGALRDTDINADLVKISKSVLTPSKKKISKHNKIAISLFEKR